MSGCIFCQQQGNQRDTIAFSSGTMKHTSYWEEWTRSAFSTKARRIEHRQPLDKAKKRAAHHSVEE
jgi:hypothetical protein